MISNRQGITRVEVLVAVVVVLVAIYALLAFTLPGSRPLHLGQMPEVLNNMRQLQLATQEMSIDNSTNGNPIQWTCSNTTPLTLEQWKRALVDRYLTETDFDHMMNFRKPTRSGYGTIITNAVTVYAVAHGDPDDTVFESTANWHGPYTPKLSGEPFEARGFIIFHVAGDGEIHYKTRTNSLESQATNTALIGSGGMYNYLPLK